VAWYNKDGSINVQLSSLPLDGKLHLREPKEKAQFEEDDIPF
jgi:hypothetical protein